VSLVQVERQDLVPMALVQTLVALDQSPKSSSSASSEVECANGSSASLEVYLQSSSEARRTFYTVSRTAATCHIGPC
jgi:hypothetical protein